MYVLFALFTLVMIFSDFMILRKNRGRFKRLYEDTDFFSQLSILQRKQWLAEEVYRKEELSIKLLSDESFHLLK